MTVDVLVTGGCGFLGAWVVRDLVRAGMSVAVLDRAPRPDPLDFVEEGLSRAVELRTGDVTDADAVRRAVADCRRVVHLAGLMTVDCRADPVRGAMVNVIGSLNLFQAACDAGLEQVVYVSTAGVYGSDDGSVPWPRSHYGAFKLAVEGSARAWWEDRGMPSVAFRPYIVYGPGESSGIAAGPSIAIRAAAEGRPATIRFSGTVGFVHVEDVARALVRAVADPAPAGAVVEPLGGEHADMGAFVAALERAVPGSRTTVEGPPLPIAPRIADTRGPWADPVTPIAEGIRRTLDHYATRRARGAAPDDREGRTR